MRVWPSILFAVALLMVVSADDGLNVDALGGKSKKFFMDMAKQAMGVPSLKPENLAAQSFFRSFLDKYTKLDEKVKQDMMQHVPKATKIFNAAAQKFNIKPMEAFQMLSTFFQNFQQGAQGDIAKKGLAMAGKLFNKNQ